MIENKVIITGGAGFIGSAVLWGLNCRGIEDVVIVDLEENKTRKNISDLKYRDYIPHDIFREQISNGVWDGEKIDCIFHLGAHTSTREKDWGKLRKDNVEYSQLLAQFAVKNNTDPVCIQIKINNKLTWMFL